MPIQRTHKGSMRIIKVDISIFFILWDSISDIELKRQEILPLQFYYDDIDIKILHYATSGNLFSPGDRYISA